MRKSFFITLLFLGGLTAFAQNGTENDAKRQAYLDKVLAKEQKYEVQAEQLHGWRFGIGYSSRGFLTIGSKSATKRGVHLSAGYRFNKHWYLGAETGIDWTFPTVLSREIKNESSSADWAYSLERHDKTYVPIIFEPRFYFNYAKFASYLYFDLGAEISSLTASVVLGGLGFDWNITNGHCLNFAFGAGMGSWESTASDHLYTEGDLSKTDGFVFSFKIGYSF